MSRFAHAMPFGAAIEPDGRVRFRLWAPGAPQLLLYLPAQDRHLAMTETEGGWFSLLTDAAEPGSHYRFELGDGLRVPDPASRAQDGDPDGASLVVDPAAYHWRRADWTGRPWTETVLYELHVGTFSPEGTFEGVKKRLAALKDLGITALSLMPIADFPGARNWGYDGVLPFAPDARYGTPEDLKDLIDTAHELGLMMILDVVYNHFGPEGNYLGRYAPDFFTDRHQTPWGDAIDFTKPPVRAFFIHNALYWLDEYRFDGLRFDAVHAILDDSEPDILMEIGRTIRERIHDRNIHLILENDDNRASLLTRDEAGRPLAYTAQWNDDFHHAAHVLLTTETTGYYLDYAQDPIGMLGRSLAQGFAYQGEASPFRNDKPRGEPTTGLPPDAFVTFLQNHDQIGNRALGERLTTLAEPDALRALRAIALLAPSTPLLFMGEEWGAEQPFLFFCDFKGDLADAVRRGRAQEFSGFPEFADDAARKKIPDPCAVSTVLRSKLVWPATRNADLKLTETLLALRAKHIVPLISARFIGAEAHHDPGGYLSVSWRYAAGHLTLRANLTGHPIKVEDAPAGPIIFASHEAADDILPPQSVFWSLLP